MAVWPFSSRKKKPPPPSSSQDEAYARPATVSEKPALVAAVPPGAARQQPPGDPESVAMLARPLTRSETETAVAKRKTLVKKSSRPGDQETPRVPLGQRRDGNNSRTSLGADSDFAAVPTLKPSTHDGKSLRSKKSIRSKGDKQRVKSLRDGATSPIPIPGRPLSGASGDIMVRESRRAPGGFGRPGSQVSLPLEESLQDEFAQEQALSKSYKVNAFDVFAPHPRIKYTKTSASMASRKEREPAIPEGDFGPKARINELADDLDARALRELMDRDRRRRERKRKLDTEKLASQLEKQDEKDKPQRTKSKGKSKSKSKKGKSKETTRSATGRDAADPAAKSRSPTPEALPTMSGPMPDNPFYTSEDYEEPPVSPIHNKYRESRSSPVSAIDNPFAEPASASSDKDDPIVETIETATAVRLSQASMSPPSSPLLAKFSTGATEFPGSSTPDIPEVPEPPSQPYVTTLPGPPRSNSGASSRQQQSSGWARFFGRSKAKPKSSFEQARNTPSESGFSTASRESFKPRAGQTTGPSIAALSGSQERTFRRSGAPQRTQSKFREDLPDLRRVPEVPTIPANVPTGPGHLSPPQSPTASRGASPDLSGPPSPFVDRVDMISTDVALNAPMEAVHPALRGEVSLSRHQSVHGSNGNRPDSGPNPALLSQSLASVDSEGSWLTGRPSKRSSSITTERNVRGSKTSLLESEQERSSPLMFGRRISNPGQRAGQQAQASGSLSNQLRQLRHPEGTGTPPEHSKPPTPTPFSESQAGESERIAAGTGEALLHTSGIARSPTLVKRDRAQLARSREGLLDIFDPQPSSAVIETVDDNGTGHAAGTVQESTNTSGDLHGGSVQDNERRESGQTDSGEDFEAFQEQAQVHEVTEIKRATSVKLGGRTHARHVSAGSARLLDLPARASGEGSRSNRNSVGTPATPSIPAAFRADTDAESENEKRE